MERTNKNDADGRSSRILTRYRIGEEKRKEKRTRVSRSTSPFLRRDSVCHGWLDCMTNALYVCTCVRARVPEERDARTEEDEDEEKAGGQRGHRFIIGESCRGYRRKRERERDSETKEKERERWRRERKVRRMRGGGKASERGRIMRKET